MIKKNPYRKEIKKKNKDTFIYDKWYLFVDELPNWDLFYILKFDHYNKNNEPIFMVKINGKNYYYDLFDLDYYQFIYGPFSSYEETREVLFHD